MYISVFYINYFKAPVTHKNKQSNIMLILTNGELNKLYGQNILNHMKDKNVKVTYKFHFF